MKHIWFSGTAAVLGGVLFYGYTALTSAAQADSLDGRLLSDPNPQAIHAQIETSRSQVAPLTETARHDFFAELFTRRIRGPQPSIAVRVAFVTKDPKHTTLRLMCPARMEPWNMDRLAVQVWREAKDCLGQSYDVDIYETYIGAAPRKAGELRCNQATPPVATISHDPSPGILHNSEPPVEDAPAKVPDALPPVANNAPPQPIQAVAVHTTP